LLERLIQQRLHGFDDQAKKPFMSQLPSPTQRPSTSVSFSGSVCHSASSYGTVSLCPASTRPPGPLPKLASRLNLPGLTCWISQETQVAQPTGEQVDHRAVGLIQARLGATDRRCGDQRSELVFHGRQRHR
jgi:hypothetical protein